MSVIVFGNGAREVAIIRSLLRDISSSSIYCYGEVSNPGITGLIGIENMFIGNYNMMENIKVMV